MRDLTVSAHRANIDRYRRLLRTHLEPHERQYLLKRLDEEQAALDALSPPKAAPAGQHEKDNVSRFGLKPNPTLVREMIMSKNSRLHSDDRNSAFEIDDLLHPAAAFDHPLDVVRDPDLTLNEKRAILSSWASDACAVESAPALRRTPKGTVVTFDDVVDALRSLDVEKTKSRGSSSARLDRAARPRRSQGPSSSGSGCSLQ
jgi:hypothetical protein